MTTSSITLPAAARRGLAPTPRTPRVAGVSSLGAAVLSILGSMIAIGIAALGLLVVPVAAIVVFGPALLARF
ncbi:hypothetical protein ITJ43_06405 [Microbacterium sp. VKM Ac-2870]|jgi:hypothetical protein|uniref:hypothetical protein n=1 Tax=Microbacterium sp. VKM Ac-2870 TaxID=2783825 RepID=UPI00188B2EC7|nr:hypothetical protein [Microbacterium sp. VKM Ac-2870]MBF4561768.1 hypothetical protein [Microbacterium sp. VKM Ac-2870]